MDEAPAYWLRLADGGQFGPTTIDRLVQWAREGRVPVDATVVPTGEGFPRAVLAVPELARILQVPPIVQGPLPAAPDSPMAAIVPYRNPPALVGYYLGVFSLVPFLGLPLGPAALICGIVGFH